MIPPDETGPSRIVFPEDAIIGEDETETEAAVGTDGMEELTLVVVVPVVIGGDNTTLLIEEAMLEPEVEAETGTLAEVDPTDMGTPPPPPPPPAAAEAEVTTEVAEGAGGKESISIWRRSRMISSSYCCLIFR